MEKLKWYQFNKRRKERLFNKNIKKLSELFDALNKRTDYDMLKQNERREEKNEKEIKCKKIS